MLGGARKEPPDAGLVTGGSGPIVLAHEPPFRIGEAEFRPATREILLGGETHVIEPRVMQVLVALHRADGAVVSKDDLTRLCWEGRIVGEDAINRVLSRLRAVAEKQAGGQFRIETITKVGYRLIETSAEASDRTSPIVSDRGPGVGRREAFIGGGAAVVAAVAAAGWHLSHRDTMPPEARTLVNNARDALSSGIIDLNSNAVSELRQAAEIAPNSAEVWGLLAFAYFKLAMSTPVEQRADVRARGFVAIKRAFSLEPYQGDALAAWASSIPVYRNWYASERAYRLGLTKRPNHPELLMGLAYVMAQVGRDSEAVVLIDKARGLLPPSPRVDSMRINALWDTGRFDETDAAMAKAYALWPRQYQIWFSYVYYLMYNGKAQEALGMISDLPNRPIGIPDWNFDWTASQARALGTRQPADIAHALDLTARVARRGAGFAENGSIFSAYFGNLDMAFGLLDALYFNRGFAMPDVYFAKEQGMYMGAERHTYNLFRIMARPLRRDPRFGQLTRQLGLDDYWRKTNSRALVVS